MKDVQKPDHVSLTTLLGRLREGRYVIPDFQREFEWKPWDIRELMRSIFLDYYIGSLLLWRGKPESFAALACEQIYGFQEKGDPTHIVLDGQQRLTAMYYAFMAPDTAAPSRQNRFLYFIRVDRFIEDADDEAFEYFWTNQGVKLLADPESQYQSHMFPLAILGKGGWDFAYWIQDYKKFWFDKAAAAEADQDPQAAREATRHVNNAHAFGERLKGVVDQYQISYIELDRDLAIEKVCDIFTQINSRGIRLDVFDLINALLKPKGLQLKHLWREAAPRLEFVDTERMNVYILQVMSILLQSYCSPKYLYYLLPDAEKKVRESDGSLRKETLIADVDTFKKRWLEAVDALDKAIKLLRHPHEFGVISSQYLPYVSILPALAALQTTARRLPANRQLDAQRKIRHWYWASVFNSRYSGSVESTAARDFQDVSTWFEDDTAEPALVGEFRGRFRSLDLRRETKRVGSVYNGIFNLLILRGARDWVTGNVPLHGALDDHHIVPKSWGKDHQLGAQIDSILNRTPLSDDTNRNVIRERLPNEYLPELIRENGEDTVQQILDSHFISPAALAILLRDPFAPEDFEAFLVERQRTLQDGIEDLLVKARLDLPPKLRELDAQVESVELELRRRINDSLDGDPDRLPPHILVKVEGRLQAAVKKNPALNMEDYQTLSGKLEYSDLRELQDTIASKALWPVFEPRFLNKDMLAKRFDQLAELRNSLRHSRTVTEIARKDGEAAILWFQEVMAK